MERLRGESGLYWDNGGVSPGRHSARLARNCRKGQAGQRELAGRAGRRLQLL